MKKCFNNFQSIFFFSLKLKLISKKLQKLEIIDIGNKNNMVSNIE